MDYTPALGATVTLAPGEEAACVFADFFDYNPQITLVKTPDRTVVLEGKPVVYTYTVTNTGNVTGGAGGQSSVLWWSTTSAPNVQWVSADEPAGPDAARGPTPALSPR